MKFLIIFLIFVFILSCKSASNLSHTNQNPTYISNSDISQIIDTLSSDYMEGRGFGSTGAEKAAIFIENFLKGQKINPYFEQYRDSFNVGARTGYNIIGAIPGTDSVLKKEFIILSAHYDHIGKSTNKNDSVYNGANDNASGVSAVLNIAKIIKYNNLNKRSVIVALFSGEEIGLKGSEHFAEKIKSKATEMYCNVNIDMIASVLTNKPGKVYISGYSKSNMGDVFNQYIGNETIANVDNEMIFDIFGLSDNYPIFEKLNIPAHTFCTFDFNNYKHYHRVSDEINNIDIENTGIIIRNIAIGISGIANSTSKEIILTD